MLLHSSALLILFLFFLAMPQTAQAVSSAIGVITTQSTESECTVGPISVNPTCVEVATAGASNGTIDITGTWTGELAFEGSINNRATWFPITGGSIGISAAGITTTISGQWAINNALTNVRVRGVDTMSGVANIHILMTPFGGGGSGTGGSISGSVTVTGNVNVTQGTSPWVSTGTSADDSTNSTAKQPTLPCKATATNPSWTEGRQVPCRTDPTTGAIYVIVPENGTTPTMHVAAAAANQDSFQVKASAGVLYGLSCWNINAAARYVKLYEVAAPTSASTVKFKHLIPGNTTGGGWSPNLPADGVAFATAVGARFTTGLADSDANAVATGEIGCAYFYR